MIDGATLKVKSKLNEFTIQQVLGAGTFGVTYLAYDSYLDKQVVIKEYFPNDIAIRADSSTVFSKSNHDKESFEYGLDSFMKEAKTIAKFDHPNVVKINSFFEANNTAYFVMDYYKGQDLEVYLQQNPQLSEEQILDIIIPLLDGLREVHSKSYLHRDIKPSNIYLKSNGSPMLIDFGATRYSIGAKSQSLSVILTPGYAPKEQYSSRSKQDAYTDIYAIGAVLYKMVTGASPIEASERSDIITNDEPDPHIGLMDMHYPNYSEHFKRAIDWALAFKPKDRPQSVREFQNALEGENTPEVESEIEPQKTEITQTNSIEKEILKEQSNTKEKKSKLGKLLLILGGLSITLVTFLIYHYDNDMPVESTTQETTQKWITPSNSVCTSNGGEIDDGNCKADWDNAQKICRASGGSLPTREDFYKVIRECGGIPTTYSDSDWESITDKNYGNTSYQSCYKQKGFDWWYWTSEEKDSSDAWGVGFERGGDGWNGKSGNGYALCVR